MRRTLIVAAVAAAALVPLSSAPAQAQGISPRTASVTTTSSTAGRVWKNSLSRRAPRPVAPAPVSTAAQAYQDRVLARTNVERARYGLPALRLSICADGYADSWAATLSSAGTLSHQALSPILQACRARSVGENVAYGNVTADQIVEMWMGSPGHRANILNASFTHLGVGAVGSSTGRWYGVQVFAAL